MEKDALHGIIQSTIATASVLARISDSYVRAKVYGELADFLLHAFAGKSQEGIKSLLEILEDVSHIQPDLQIAVAQAQRALLHVYVQLLRKSIPPHPEPRKTPPVEREPVPMNENKRNIFHFIQRSPSTRAKDIVDQFNVLSARTVKRNLHELMAAGFIKRQVKDRAVRYSVTERQA